MTTKPTPGPWCVREGAYSTHSHPVRFWKTDVFAEAGFVAQSNGATAEEAMFNAELIAAAPALLDALRKLANEASGFLAKSDIERHGLTNNRVLRLRIEEARDALARAEGRMQ